MTNMKQYRQPPTVSLTFVNDKLPFFGILCQSSFCSQFLGFVFFSASSSRVESTYTTVFFEFPV